MSTILPLFFLNTVYFINAINDRKTPPNNPAKIPTLNILFLKGILQAFRGYPEKNSKQSSRWGRIETLQEKINSPNQTTKNPFFLLLLEIVSTINSINNRLLSSFCFLAKKQSILRGLPIGWNYKWNFVGI